MNDHLFSLLLDDIVEQYVEQEDLKWLSDVVWNVANEAVKKVDAAVGDVVAPATHRAHQLWRISAMIELCLLKSIGEERAARTHIAVLFRFASFVESLTVSKLSKIDLQTTVFIKREKGIDY